MQVTHKRMGVLNSNSKFRLKSKVNREYFKVASTCGIPRSGRIIFEIPRNNETSGSEAIQAKQRTNFRRMTMSPYMQGKSLFKVFFIDKTFTDCKPKHTRS